MRARVGSCRYAHSPLVTCVLSVCVISQPFERSLQENCTCSSIADARYDNEHGEKAAKLAMIGVLVLSETVSTSCARTVNDMSAYKRQLSAHTSDTVNVEGTTLMTLFPTLWPSENVYRTVHMSAHTSQRQPRRTRRNPPGRRRYCTWYARTRSPCIMSS
jgi:hypothetical protein